ncbi:uncharacterized protein [Panulirus ornatus]|uniref:uncharacterized protein n=1 Tax=Panulirus ornatus TaxID=150431 RepID=UPI003A86BA50
MSEAVKCRVCLEQYEPDDREPLMLPCGHTFCRSCVLAGRTTGRHRCPSCKRDLTLIEVQELPINFQVLELISVFTKLQHESCGEHGDELRYWCRECERSLCSLCLYGDHPQGHQVLHAKTFLQEKKQVLKDQVTDIRTFIEETKYGIDRSLRKFYQKMTKLCQFETDVTTFFGNMLKARSIESILVLEETWKSLQAERLCSLSVDVTKELTDVEEHEAGGDDVGEESVALGESDAEEHTEVGDGVEDDDDDDDKNAEVVLNQQETSLCNEQVVDGRRARLDYHDGKLLLHSLSHRNDNRFFLKLPSEVFLELGVGGRCLGRVYICLWTNLRSAQHFLALCLGVLGPSHVGAYFRSISDKDKERETIWCTEYRLKNGDKCDKALMTDLEWGGEHSRVPREGLVVLYTNDVHNYGFGICTTGKEDASFSGPFGEVLSGMDVVRRAVNHDPVTHVNITDCGVIIPDLAP